MATYDNDLRLKEITTGDEDGTWGTSTNLNLELIGEALSYGTQDCFASDADATTTVADSATDPARSMYFKVTSSATLTATRTLTIAPNTISRVMWIENATTGSQSITISQGSGGTVTIPNGDVKVVYLDGAGAGAAVVDALTSLNLTDVSSLVATTADINGGTIDGVTIGGSTAAAGTFTTFTSTGIDDNASSTAITIDSSQNVGIGTSSPDVFSRAYTGTIVGISSASGESAFMINSSGTNVAALEMGRAGARETLIYDTSTTTQIGSVTSKPVTFTTGGTESMRIDTSGNLLINDTSGSGDKVYVGGKVRASGGFKMDGGTEIIPVTAETMSFYTNSAERMRIDSSGRVGIGATPSSWLSTFSVIQGPAGSGLSFYNSGSLPAAYLTSNAYYDSTASDWVAVVTDQSGLYTIEGTTGRHLWYTKPATTTAGSVIGFTNSMTLDSAGLLKIGSSGTVTPYTYSKFAIDTGTYAFMDLLSTGASGINFGDAASVQRGSIEYDHSSDFMRFITANGERMRIDASGHKIFGKTSNSFSTAGTTIYGDATYNGLIEVVVDGQSCMNINRLTSDGTLVGFYQAGGFEGSISVSGSTVSYNGGHLARWTQMDSDNGSLLKGTVMTNLDDMCVWKQAVFTTQHLVSPAVEAVEAVAEIPEELDEEGNIIQEYVPAVEAVEAQDAVYEDIEQRETYEGNAADGDVIDFEFEGQTYSATVVFEDNEQLNKMEVSSVEGDANVAGVFVSYDDDGDITIAMTGDMVIRIAQGTTVARGDLLMSAGDGTAKPQDDDIVRAKTIAKVTSTHVSHTYDDGSYLVPCVLMAC